MHDFALRRPGSFLERGIGSSPRSRSKTRRRRVSSADAMGTTPRTVSSLVIAVISVHRNSLMRLRSIYQSLVQTIAITVRVPAQVQINDLFAEWISQQTARLELDAPHRAETGDIGRLKTRSATPAPA